MPVTGKYAPWRIWALVIFWVLQFLFFILTFASCVYSIAQTQDSRVRPAVAIVVIVISFVLTVAECIQCGRLNLKPRLYLISGLIKFIIWITICIVSLVGISVLKTAHLRGQAVFFYVPVILLFTIPVIYGSVVCHQARRAAEVYKLNADTMYATGAAFGTEHNHYELGAEYDAATSAVTPGTHQYNDVELKHYPPV